jgi:hypothetical protein
MFPVRDTREELKDAINGGLKKRPMSDRVCAILLDIVKPYETGNFPIWALHELDITDKHKLIIPVFQLMRFDNVCLADEKDVSFTVGPYYMDAASRIKLKRGEGLTVKDKGHATATILFNIGVPFQGEPIIPTLHQLTEVVTGVVKAFQT